MDLVPVLARWLHFLAGIMWIGLLYYFNFVQMQALKAAAADGTAAGITKHVAPRALFYFRWSALGTANSARGLKPSIPHPILSSRLYTGRYNPSSSHLVAP